MKEDLRLSAHLTTNMIANMGKGLHISMETLLRICEALDCDIADVIALERKESQHESEGKGKFSIWLFSGANADERGTGATRTRKFVT